MKLSRKWLSEFVDVDASDKEFAEAMTISGSKVEITEDLGAEIGEIDASLEEEFEEDAEELEEEEFEPEEEEDLEYVTGDEIYTLSGGDDDDDDDKQDDDDF